MLNKGFEESNYKIWFLNSLSRFERKGVTTRKVFFSCNSFFSVLAKVFLKTLANTEKIRPKAKFCIFFQCPRFHSTVPFDGTPLVFQIQITMTNHW